jgi:hypothetical protein
LEIDATEGVTYTTQFIGTRRGFATDSEQVHDASGKPMPRASHKYSEQIGTVLLETRDPAPRYEFAGDELYVRARVVSDRVQENPFAEGDLEMAWTQPVPVR